ncbi:MAG: prephenate dehydrogenase/arogenate dehydrogenase family protein, partial [Candidatus Altarchaeaceae archaeon]
MTLTVVIVGGCGGMGKIFAKIFKNENFRVIITDPNEEKGKELANEINVEYSKDNKIARIADITIVTVPIEKTISVIEEVAPIIKDNSLIVDFTSVKKSVCEALEKFTNKNAEIISIHPMFGPKIPSIEGQVFILIPIRTEKWINFIKNFLIKYNAKFIETTP